MSKPAAKQGDRVTGVDLHLIQPPGPTSPVLVPHAFNGVLQINLSPNVTVLGQPAATVGSIAQNTPPHIPSGGTFVVPPTNMGEIVMGSATVQINGKSAARAGDPAKTCNDPAPLPVGTTQATGAVMIGD